MNRWNVFNSEGSIISDAFAKHVISPLVKSSLFPIEKDYIEKVAEDIIEFHCFSSHTVFHNLIVKYEQKLKDINHELLTSNVRLSRVGERSNEWKFFQNRRTKIPNSIHNYISEHQKIGLKVKKLLTDCLLDNLSINLPKIFYRYKSISSILRKMELKRLHCWEIGDYISFFIGLPNFSQIPSIVDKLERKYHSTILYKQNGFIDTIVDKIELDPAVARRIFYIIQFDEVTCFEIQLVTLRQLIYIHLSHPNYIRHVYNSNELIALKDFGDRGYLMDLIELFDDIKA